MAPARASLHGGRFQSVPGGYTGLMTPASRLSDRGGRIDPGYLTGLRLLIASNAKRAPRCGVRRPGSTPPNL